MVNRITVAILLLVCLFPSTALAQGAGADPFDIRAHVPSDTPVGTVKADRTVVYEKSDDEKNVARQAQTNTFLMMGVFAVLVTGYIVYRRSRLATSESRSGRQ